MRYEITKSDDGNSLVIHGFRKGKTAVARIDCSTVTDAYYTDGGLYETPQAAIAAAKAYVSRAVGNPAPKCGMDNLLKAVTAAGHSLPE